MRHPPPACRAHPRRRPCAKEAALRGYDGPTLFAVPGNHDWIDGLDCFQVGGWVGGWVQGWVGAGVGLSVVAAAALTDCPACGLAQL